MARGSVGFGVRHLSAVRRKVAPVLVKGGCVGSMVGIAHPVGGVVYSGLFLVFGCSGVVLKKVGRCCMIMLSSGLFG